MPPKTRRNKVPEVEESKEPPITKPTRRRKVEPVIEEPPKSAAKKRGASQMPKEVEKSPEVNQRLKVQDGRAKSVTKKTTKKIEPARPKGKAPAKKGKTTRRKKRGGSDSSSSPEPSDDSSGFAPEEESSSSDADLSSVQNETDSMPSQHSVDQASAAVSEQEEQPARPARGRRAAPARVAPKQATDDFTSRRRT